MPTSVPAIANEIACCNDHRGNKTASWRCPHPPLLPTPKPLLQPPFTRKSHHTQKASLWEMYGWQKLCHPVAVLSSSGVKVIARKNSNIFLWHFNAFSSQVSSICWGIPTECPCLGKTWGQFGHKLHHRDTFTALEWMVAGRPLPESQIIGWREPLSLNIWLTPMHNSNAFHSDAALFLALLVGSCSPSGNNEELQFWSRACQQRLDQCGWNHHRFFDLSCLLPQFSWSQCIILLSQRTNVQRPP